MPKQHCLIWKIEHPTSDPTSETGTWPEMKRRTQRWNSPPEPPFHAPSRAGTARLPTKLVAPPFVAENRGLADWNLLFLLGQAVRSHMISNITHRNALVYWTMVLSITDHPTLFDTQFLNFWKSRSDTMWTLRSKMRENCVILIDKICVQVEAIYSQE